MPQIKFYADTLRGQNQLFKFHCNSRRDADKALKRCCKALNVILLRAAWFVSKRQGINERIY